MKAGKTEHEEPKGLTMGVLARRIEAATLHGAPRTRVRAVTHDSRKARAGALFCALVGARSDGHAFVADAVARGAVAVMSEREPQRDDVAWLRVRDMRGAMATAACEIYGHPSRRLNVIGVTGTNGKTTVAHLIAHLLRGFGQEGGLLGTIAYNLVGETIPAPHTTPEAPDLQEFLFRVEARKGKFAAMEVSSHALALRRVAGTRFSGAIFTNLTRDHLDFHKTMEDYLRAKLALFEGLDEKAWAAVNVDDEHASRFLAACKGKTVTFGLAPRADVRAESVSLSIEGTRFDVVTPRGRGRVTSALLGMPNVSNLLAAFAAAEAMGLPFDETRRVLESAPPVRGRFERIHAQGLGFDILVDYAHTDDALRNVLRTARALRPKRILTVFGCGGDRDSGKRVPMGRAAGEMSDFVFLTSDNPRSEDPLAILDDVEPGVREFRAPHEYVKEPDRRRAIEAALRAARAGDIVVLAGKGHETYQILKDKTIPFDDRAVAEEILRTLSPATRNAAGMALREMAAAMRGTLVRGNADIVPTGVSIDTRTLRAGEIFFAVRGPRHDGHAFVAEAAAKGACAAVIEGEEPRHLPADLALVRVDDTTRALGRLGRAFLEAWPCVSAGITGSAGKTTTKELLRAMLAARFHVLATEGNLNNLYGVPLSLARRLPEHDAIVCEMGISTPGEMARLSEIFTPDVMLFTCIAPAHIEHFGSLEAIYREKTSVLKNMKKTATAVVNGDDPFLRRVTDDFAGRTILYGTGRDCDVRMASLVSRGFEGVSFDAVFSDGEKVPFELALPGAANAMNALGAAAAARALGVSAGATAQAAKTVGPVQGRGRLMSLTVKGVGVVRVADDTYNANPRAFRAALESLRETPCEGRRVVVAGDMLELGADARSFHEALGCDLAALGADAVFAAGALASAVADAARAGGVRCAESFPDATEAGRAAAAFVRAGDVVLVKGSRGMKMEEAIHVMRKAWGGAA